MQYFLSVLYIHHRWDLALFFVPGRLWIWVRGCIFAFSSCRIQSDHLNLSRLFAVFSGWSEHSSPADIIGISVCLWNIPGIPGGQCGMLCPEGGCPGGSQGCLQESGASWICTDSAGKPFSSVPSPPLNFQFCGSIYFWKFLGLWNPECAGSHIFDCWSSSQVRIGKLNGLPSCSSVLWDKYPFNPQRSNRLKVKGFLMGFV